MCRFGGWGLVRRVEEKGKNGGKRDGCVNIDSQGLRFCLYTRCDQDCRQDVIKIVDKAPLRCAVLCWGWTCTWKKIITYSVI